MSVVSLTLALLPALALLLALLSGRYPGERTLERLRSRRRRPLAIASWRPPRWRARARRRSGELLAASLAGRGPPALPACA